MPPLRVLIISWTYWPTSGWDLLASLGHPCKFQRVSHLDSVTAQHSSSGRQPHFAALNRGCHLYSAGRQSCWALAHISSDGIRGIIHKRVAKYSDFGPVEGYISETVEDRR